MCSFRLPIVCSVPRPFVIEKWKSQALKCLLSTKVQQIFIKNCSWGIYSLAKLGRFPETSLFRQLRRRTCLCEERKLVGKVLVYWQQSRSHPLRSTRVCVWIWRIATNYSARVRTLVSTHQYQRENGEPKMLLSHKEAKPPTALYLSLNLIKFNDRTWNHQTEQINTAQNFL